MKRQQLFSVCVILTISVGLMAVMTHCGSDSFDRMNVTAATTPTPVLTSVPTPNPTQSPGSSIEIFTNTNGTRILMATTTTSSNAKTTAVKDQQGNTIVIAVVTVTGVSLSFPGKTTETNNLTFSSPQASLPDDMRTNMFAAYVANRVLSANSSSKAFPQIGNWVNQPGCDLVGGILSRIYGNCPLRCCALHDYLYDIHQCNAISWIFPFGASLECNLANHVAALCILFDIGCFDIGQKCYSTTCHQYYECPGKDTCDTKVCPEPCATATPTPVATPTPAVKYCYAFQALCRKYGGELNDWGWCACWLDLPKSTAIAFRGEAEALGASCDIISCDPCLVMCSNGNEVPPPK